MERISRVQKQLIPSPVTEPNQVFPTCSSDYFSLDDLLSAEESEMRYLVRNFAETKILPLAVEHWERAEFPFQLINELKKLDLCGGMISGYGCPSYSHMSNVMILLELARVDTSSSTFWMVHNCLAMKSISLCGSEEQKRRFLPAMAKLEKVGCFALTEPERGSDASSLETTARKVEGGWLLNGKKRWIGNGTFADVIVVWATDEESKEIFGFIVEKGNPGYSATKIENKISLRIVQNADIVLQDCFVPSNARLPKAKSFASGPGQALTASRVLVAWQPVGMSMGIFDHCVDYLKRRRQFGAPLASFQLNQEKLARMAANIQAMIMMAWRLSSLYTAGKMTAGQASLTKAHNSLRAREVAALGRELMGGNGIVGDFHVARLFCDMESIYTYEGTYDVNCLVAAREITGMAAIKSSFKPKQSF